MSITETFVASFRIVALLLLAAGALAGYVWFLPLGVVLEITLWVCFDRWM